MWQVKRDQVVAKQEADAFSECVQLFQSRKQIALLEVQRCLWLIPANCRETMNPAIVQSDFKVYREAARRKTTHGRCRVGLSQFVPGAPTGAVLAELALVHQGAEMLLERVAIAAGQPNRIAHCHAAMLSREFDDLQREFG